MTKEKLKPLIKSCPFCGGEAKIKITRIQHNVVSRFVAVYVGCYNKGCIDSCCSRIQNSEVESLRWSDSFWKMTRVIKPMAIQAWNTRADARGESK